MDNFKSNPAFGPRKTCLTCRILPSRSCSRKLKGYKLSTAVEQRIYLDSAKTIRRMLRKLKKRKVAEFNQEHEKKTPDDNEGKQDIGITQNKTQPNPRITLPSNFTALKDAATRVYGHCAPSPRASARVTSAHSCRSTAFSNSRRLRICPRP